MDTNQTANSAAPQRSWITRALNSIEVIGNKLPDPAMLFLLLMIVVWIFSWLLSGVQFEAINPQSGEPIGVANLLTGQNLTSFLTTMVETFTGFAPLGVVLVAMLGVGVAEQSGYISALLRKLLSFTPKKLLTPMLILIAIISHTAADVGYVVVIPLGGIIFYAAGRHPLVGIAAAFAGVSGGFSANFIPSSLDPLLMGFTEEGVRVLDSDLMLHPLINLYFTAASCLVIVAVGWWITDRIIEPRLSTTELDGDKDDMPQMPPMEDRESRAMWVATLAMTLAFAALIAVLMPESSPLRDPQNGKIADAAAPIMQSIVPLIFVFFILPGIIYGYMTGTFKKSKDVVDAMSESMGAMAYYIVMAFFCALFVSEFGRSGLAELLAVKGGNFLQELALPGGMTLFGIIILVAFINMFVGSASAKWGLLAPIFVPMLMQVGISPELTQAAYRVGDSSTNIITPLLPYFPLVVVYAQRYVKGTGIGTLVSLMLPYSIVFLLTWSLFLVAYWMLGIPLGPGTSYVYPPV